MKISSSAFADGTEIPRRYTCEGDDVSPPLSFTGTPKGAKSLVLVVDDPDAPDPARPQRTWVHWVVYNLPPTTTEISEGGELPGGARLGINDWGKAAYGGPCPPKGRHRYFHRVYALDTVLDLDDPTKNEIDRAMAGHVLAKGECIGTYQKSAG